MVLLSFVCGCKNYDFSGLVGFSGMADSTPAGLCPPTTANLTARLFIRLQKEGSLNRLSADLRGKLIEYLNRRQSDDDDVAADVGTQQRLDRVRSVPRQRERLDGVVISPKHPLGATNWLIADHLRRNKFSSTLSVFHIECGQPDVNDMFSVTDVLSFLGYNLLTTNATGLVSEYLDDSSKLFLWKLLLSPNMRNNDNDLRPIARLSDRPVISSSEKAVQTIDQLEYEQDAITSGGVESKLRALDAIYSRKKAVIKPYSPLSSNDALGALERIVAVNAVAELGHEVKRLRENETKQAKDSERERCRQEMEDFRRALEDHYRNRLERLMERERDVTIAIDKQKNAIEEELYRQRQQIIGEISSLNRRQTEWEADAAVRQMKMNRECARLDQLKMDIVRREEDFVQRESVYDDWLNTQRKMIVDEERQNYAEAQRALEVKQKELQGLQTRLTEFEKELQLKRRAYEDSIANSEKLRADLATSLRHIDSLKNQTDVSNSGHREEVARLRTKLEDAESRAKVSDAGRNEVMLEIMDRMEKARGSDKNQLLSLALQVKYLEAEKAKIIKASVTRQQQMQRASDKVREQQDEMDTLHSHIKELEALMGLRNRHSSTITSSQISPLQLHQSTVNKSRQETSDVGPVDVHETYFDTSLSVSHLPPELELEPRVELLTTSSSAKPCQHLTFTQLAQDRIRLLELQGQELEDQYKTFKLNRSPPRRFRDDEERTFGFQKNSTPCNDQDQVIKFRMPVDDDHNHRPLSSQVAGLYLSSVHEDLAESRRGRPRRQLDVTFQEQELFADQVKNNDCRPSSEQWTTSGINAGHFGTFNAREVAGSGELDNVLLVPLIEQRPDCAKPLRGNSLDIQHVRKEVKEVDPGLNNVIEDHDSKDRKYGSSEAVTGSSPTWKSEEADCPMESKKTVPEVLMCSPIDLDSVWKRATSGSNDSTSGSVASAIKSRSSSDVVGLPAPLHSTPQSTIMESDRILRESDGCAVPVHQKLTIMAESSSKDEVDNEMQQARHEEDVSGGGVSDAGSQKSDFEW